MIIQRRLHGDSKQRLFKENKMTREEHIKWCKEKAIAEMDYYHDPTKAIISIMSDLRKHPETNGDALQSLFGAMLMTGRIKTRQEAINFINGFN